MCIITPQSISSRFSPFLSLAPGSLLQRLISSWPSLLSPHVRTATRFESIHFNLLPGCLPAFFYLNIHRHRRLTSQAKRRGEKKRNRTETKTTTKKNRLMYSPNTSLYQYSSVFIEREELLRRESNRSMCMCTHTRISTHETLALPACRRERERARGHGEEFFHSPISWMVVARLFFCSPTRHCSLSLSHQHAN